MVMCEILDASKRIPGCDIDALWQSHYGLMKRLIRHDPQALPKLEQKLAAFDTFQLISVAIVGEDGREFYGECSDFDRALCSDFVREVVLPQLGQVPNRAMPFTQLRRELLDWLSGVPLKRSLCCALTSKAICNSLNT
jgi:hypothetical protein